MEQHIDFTSCTRVTGKAYSGANGQKIAIQYNDKQYMVKFPPSGREKPTDLSYINSCISEHIGCKIFNLLGIEAQNTILGTFHIRDKEKIVCACEDFTASGKIFYDFCSIKNTIIDSEHNGNGTELTEILETISKQQFVNPATLVVRFWDMLIVDAIIGNFDRHNGNWGFLYDNNTESAQIAPVFDCGSSLLPQADEKTMLQILKNEDEMNARIYNFPTSAIKINNKKLNYFDFISSCEYKGCNYSLAKIAQRIDMNKIMQVIDETPYLSDLQHEFYRKYISCRIEKIVTSVYRKMCDKIMSEDLFEENEI